MFYPKLCIACRSEPPVNGEPFCLTCYLELPFTDHFSNPENAFVKHFWGRIKINHGAAMFEFKKEGKVQRLLHDLKYRKKRDIGILTGAYIGDQILQSKLFKKADLIVPIPISKKRILERGYNQSALIAEGIHKKTCWDWNENLLIKTRDTGSQTSRTRSERLDNVSNSFLVQNDVALEGKHILLVDDVITTGATLESCALVLKESGVREISCVTLAIAKN